MRYTCIAAEAPIISFHAMLKSEAEDLTPQAMEQMASLIASELGKASSDSDTYFHKAMLCLRARGGAVGAVA